MGRSSAADVTGDVNLGMPHRSIPRFLIWLAGDARGRGR